MPVGRGDGVTYPEAFSTLASFARIKRPRWRPVGLNNQHLQSHGKIGDCEQSNPHILLISAFSIESELFSA